MLTQCPECPRRAAGLDGPCVGQYMMNDAYCVRARMGDRRYIDTILTWQPGGEPLNTTDQADPAAKAEPPSTVSPSVAESIALLGRMRSCTNWVARSDCGCGTNECRAGKGRDGLVTYRDCFACLQTPHP